MLACPWKQNHVWPLVGHGGHRAHSQTDRAAARELLLGGWWRPAFCAARHGAAGRPVGSAAVGRRGQCSGSLTSRLRVVAHTTTATEQRELLQFFAHASARLSIACRASDGLTGGLCFPQALMQLNDDVRALVGFAQCSGLRNAARFATPPYVLLATPLALLQMHPSARPVRALS